MAPPSSSGKAPTETFDPDVPAGARAEVPADDAATLGELPARFAVKRTLGRGGMGVVLEVEDRTLGRTVALKVLPAARRGEAERARFVREARAAAGLRHPAIVTVYDVDPEGAFMVMELAPGGSLAERGRLPLAEVRRVASAMLAALATAHAAGVVHRDVKPGNLLVGDGGAIKLADFGIASIGARGRTTTGNRAGTPAYMAPEQLRGQRADVRADLYGAGATLFELATGAPLHPAAGSVDDVAARVSAATGDRRLAAAIARAVRERPEERFASADAMQAAIAAPRRWRPRGALAAAGLAGLALVAILAGGSSRPSRPSPTPPAPRLAMLPFVERSGAPQLEYASYGLPQILATELGRIGGVDVIDHHRLAGVVGGDRADARWLAAARDQGAALAIDGEVGGAEPAFTIRVRVRTLAGAVVLERSATAALAEVPRAVRGLAPAVAAAVLGHPVTAPIGRPGNPEAEALLQRGIAELAAHDINVAGEDLRRAAELDPGNAEALYYRALQLWWMSSPADEVRAAIGRIDRDALTAAQREFLDGLALFIAHDFAGAAAHFERELARFPEDRDLLYGEFEACFHAGRPADAVAVYRRLRALYPRFGLGVIHVLDYHVVRGDPDGLRWALGLLDRSARSNAPVWPGLAAAAVRDYPRAIAELEGVLEDEAAPPVQRAQARDALAFTHALGGQVGFARALVEDDRFAPNPELVWSFAAAAGDQPAAAAAEATLVATLRDQQPGLPRMVSAIAIAALVLAAERPAGDLAAAGARVARETPAERAGDLTPSALRAMIGCRLDDRAAIAAAASSRFAEVAALAEACTAEQAGALVRAEAAWRRALADVTDARLAALEWQAVARVARARGDRAGVRAACDEVTRPRRASSPWGPAAGPCRLWSIEAALADGDVAAARAELAVLERLRRPGDPLLAAARAALEAR